MATLTVSSFAEEPNAIDLPGDAVAAAALGDEFQNSGRTGFYVENTSGSPRTVTFDAPGLCSHGFQHDAAVVVPDGFVGFIAHHFEAQRFNDGTGKVQVTYSSEAGLAVAAVRLAD